MNHGIVKDTIGVVLGAGAFAAKKANEGFNWNHFNQEMIEDVFGAIISVTVGFVLMRVYRGLFPNKKKEDVKSK